MLCLFYGKMARARTRTRGEGHKYTTYEQRAGGRREEAHAMATRVVIKGTGARRGLRRTRF